MQTNLLWTGRECYSLENCLVKVTNAGSEITSTIIGHYQETIYKVEYLIKTNHNWETVFFEINSQLEISVKVYHRFGAKYTTCVEV